MGFWVRGVWRSVGRRDGHCGCGVWGGFRHGFSREVGFVGVEVDGDRAFAREVEALGSEGEVVDLGGRRFGT